MRKELMIVTLIGAMAVTAHANVYVAWQADAGFFFDVNANVGILGNGESAVAQLIWSADNVADAADANTANYVTGDDVWLADFTLTNNGGLFEDYALFGFQTTDDGGAQPAGGYIYGRIFESTTPEADGWYYAGEVVAADDLNPAGAPPDTPQQYNLNRDSVNGDAIDGGFGAQVVPEPASIALMLLGAAIVGVRRRRR